MPKKVIYYRDELNDDFSGTSIKRKEVDHKYVYYHKNIIYRVIEFIVYYIIAFPIVFLLNKIIYLVRYKNRKVLKEANGGYFIYGNHTNMLLDAYNPSIIVFPKKSHIIANPDATSIPGIRMIVKMLGAIPLPSDKKTMQNYRNAIKRHIRRGRVVAIYPEARIWPYYTDIRPFSSVSFHYPVEENVPCFAFTSVYEKRKIGKSPKVVTYIDGPFFRDDTLPKQKAIEKLRDEVYLAMKKRVDENPKYEYYKYIKVDKD